MKKSFLFEELVVAFMFIVFFYLMSQLFGFIGFLGILILSLIFTIIWNPYSHPKVLVRRQRALKRSVTICLNDIDFMIAALIDTSISLSLINSLETLKQELKKARELPESPNDLIGWFRFWLKFKKIKKQLQPLEIEVALIVNETVEDRLYVEATLGEVEHDICSIEGSDAFMVKHGNLCALIHNAKWYHQSSKSILESSNSFNKARRQLDCAVAYIKVARAEMLRYEQSTNMSPV